MPLVRISDFGKLALALDPQSTLLEPGQWSKLLNIDLLAGDIRSALGDTMLFDQPPVKPIYTYAFEGILSTYLVISDGTQVYVFRNEEWVELTTVGTAPSEFKWDDSNETWDTAASYWDAYTEGGDPGALVQGRVTYTVFLGTLIVSSTEGVPLYWPDETGKLELLPSWDPSWRCFEIHAFTNHLVALGFDDQLVSGAKFRVAWSDAAAEGEIPQAWKSTSENLAGSVQLRDTDKYLVTAELFGDDLAIYKKDSIYRMFLRGDEFIMGFDRVIVDHGCDSPDGVTALQGMHFFADSGDIRVFDGQTTKSIADLAVRSSLAAGISDQFRDATKVVAWPYRSEIWIGVVPAGSDHVDAVLIYNLIHGGSWVTKNYPNTISMIVGSFAATSVTDTQIWDEGNDIWDNAEERWNLSVFEPAESGLIIGRRQEYVPLESLPQAILCQDFSTASLKFVQPGVFADGGEIYRVDVTNTDPDGNAKYCVAERSGFVISDLEQNVTIKAVYLEMEGTATVDVEIGAQWHAGDTIRWTLPQPFTPGIDKRINVRITGAPCALRISSREDAWWRLGAVSFLLTEASRR
jgi:hypothetical protein